MFSNIALLARYYDRNPEILNQPDLVDEGEVVRKRSDSSRGRYWNLLNALEEELALEALSRQGPELEGMQYITLRYFYIVFLNSANLSLIIYVFLYLF